MFVVLFVVHLFIKLSDRRYWIILIAKERLVNVRERAARRIDAAIPAAGSGCQNARYTTYAWAQQHVSGWCDSCR